MAQRAGETAGGGPSVVEFDRQRLVEHEVWYRLGLGGIEGGRLIQEVALGWAAGVGFVEQAVAVEVAQHATLHDVLQFMPVLGSEPGGLMEADLSVGCL